MRRASTAVGALLARATAATHDPARHLSRASLPASSIVVTAATTASEHTGRGDGGHARAQANCAERDERQEASRSGRSLFSRG